ncbi:MAG TPA: glycosyltransferase family 4 protein [Candidatus Sumerlaeota bacterium]|nr:glycosyltransferase family 4 protein [Candidatus Sumerlaeota bacterium]
MKLLVVSTYPPLACGIGRYAAQQVDFLRREGHWVDVLTPAGCDGDFQDDLYGRFRILALLKYLWAYDMAYLHFAPQFFYDTASRASRFMTSFGFLLVMLLAGKRITFMIHETGYKIGQEGRGLLRHRIDRWYWRLAGRVVFHSTRERDTFCWFYRLKTTRANLEVWPHDKYMVPLWPHDRAEARRRLSLEPDKLFFLCIGFVQPHKGFDRALEAFLKTPGEHLRFKIVGSVRINWDVAHQYAQRLHELAEQDARAEFVESFVNDEMFDMWVAAADYVVLPYREIWTSSVAARARLYGRPLIAADTGGLAEQLTEGSMLFRDDDELVECLRRIAARTNPSPAGEPTPTPH